MTFLKHKTGAKRQKKSAAKRETENKPLNVVVTGPTDPHSPSDKSLKHDVYIDGFGGIESSLDSINRSLSRLTYEGAAVNISSGFGKFNVSLVSHDEEDGFDRLITAFERIADSLAMLAGLSRPRLESWQEQDEYEPRYKNIASDGGAPGPPAAQGGAK